MKARIAAAALAALALAVTASPALAAVKIDFSSVLNADVVVNRDSTTLNGYDAAQESVDRSINNFAFATQSAVAEGEGNCGTDPDGLPDNAHFAANSDHPEIDLDWADDDNGDNAVRLLEAGDDFTIDVPDGVYGAVDVFATAGDAPRDPNGFPLAQVSITRTYTDATSSDVSFFIPDWFEGPYGGQYLLSSGLDRMKATANGMGDFECHDANTPSIVGDAFFVDPSKTLASIRIARNTAESAAGPITIFGGLLRQLIALTVVADGGGKVTSNAVDISCGSGDTDCTESITEGEQVTLTPQADAGQAFDSWEGCDLTVNEDCIVVMDAARSVTAHFVPLHTLTVTRNGRGTVNTTPAGIACGGDCANDYREGTSVTLRAFPVTGARFAGWSGGGCSGTDPCTLTMDGDKSVTATFEDVPPADNGGNQPPGGSGPAPPGGGPTGPTLPPVTTPTEVAFGTLATAPAARRCRRTRRLKLKLKKPAGATIRAAKITVGRKSRTVTGAALTKAIVVRGSKSGSFTVTVELTLSDGRVLKAKRRYRRCPKKKRAGALPRRS